MESGCRRKQSEVFTEDRIMENVCPKCEKGVLKLRFEASSVLECTFCGHTVYKKKIRDGYLKEVKWIK